MRLRTAALWRKTQPDLAEQGDDRSANRETPDAHPLYLTILLPTVLTGFGADAGPLVPKAIGALKAEPVAAAACGEAGNAQAVANFNQGMIFYVQGEMDHAIAKYGEAIRVDPAMTAAYDGRGHALHAKGDMHGAMANFDEAERVRFIQRIEWLAGRFPHNTRSRDTEGAVALVAL